MTLLCVNKAATIFTVAAAVLGLSKTSSLGSLSKNLAYRLSSINSPKYPMPPCLGLYLPIAKQYLFFICCTNNDNT